MVLNVVEELLSALPHTIALGKPLSFCRQLLQQCSKPGGDCGQQGTDLEIIQQLAGDSRGKERGEVSVSGVVVPQERVSNFVLVSWELV